MTTGKHSFKDRQDCPDSGEILFENYCETIGVKYHRVGFDSKLDPVSNFWKVHPTLRSLPDYLVEKENDLYWCHVKGTANMKLKDFVTYSDFNANLSHQCHFFVVFCFKDQDVIFRTMDEIRKLMVGQSVQQWHDGVQYINLNLNLIK